MAARATTAERVAWAAARLLECRATAAVVSELSDHAGISRRQARRYVAMAHRQLVADLEETGLDRQQLVAQLTAGLVQTMGLAMASGHPSAAVGASRELRKLLGLAAADPLHKPPPTFPRFR